MSNMTNGSKDEAPISRIKNYLLILGLLMAASYLVVSTDNIDAAPEGYTDLEDLVSQFPAKVIKDGEDYHILGDISLPATQPLYIGPGSTIYLDEGVNLNLSAPAIFEGTGPERIMFNALGDASSWGGIYLLERDPTTGTVMKNVTISGAEKSIWSDIGDLYMENMVIKNSSRSALEVRGPLGSGNLIEIRDSVIENAFYYGIHLLKVEDTILSDVTINASGTGLRAVGSHIDVQNSDITESNSFGIYLKDSELFGKDMDLISTGGSNTNQIFSLNSTIDIDNVKAEGSATALSIFDGSELKMTGSDISNCFIDGLYINGSNAELEDVMISDCKRNAIEAYSSDIKLLEAEIVNNGPRSGDISYSSIYSEDTHIDLIESVITGSGYSHFEASSSDIKIIGSTLGASGSNKLTLDRGSNVEMIDMLPLSDVDFKDSGSSLKNLINFQVSVKSFSTGDAIEGATVDVQDFDGEWIISADTGDDGLTEPEIIPVSLRNSEGTFTYLPMQVVVQSPGFEVSTATLEEPAGLLEVDLYPPNEPPSLSLISPVNGTTGEGDITVEGNIEDDLDVFMVKYRFDSSPYRTIDDLSVGPGGGFETTIDVSGLSNGEHTLFIHAFDGSHLSGSVQRTIYVISSELNDTDSDGISNQDEDKNGNGIVDEGETDPNDPDTDDDGLSDGLEIDNSDDNTTDPLNPDTDGDFLRDGDEDTNANGRVDEKETNPNDPDTDGDGVIDSEDFYPLDETRVDDPGGDNGSILILALAVILLILLIIALYLLYIRSKDGAKVPEDEQKGPGPFHGPRPKGPSRRNADQSRRRRPRR